MVIRLIVAASIIALFVIIYALVECVRTRPHEVRSISKPAWILSILLLPLIGAVLWFALGRPRAGAQPDPYSAPGSSSRSSAPDDDAAFLRRLQAEREHKAREAELRRREDELNKRENGSQKPGEASSGPSDPDQEGDDSGAGPNPESKDT
ncbi:PLDc N-terminal domain-containing protein [Zhihengliuella flava]|uniref:Cardiolipin synthase N-terminal domain-containing protein n=1 Tax=Zhihengliuella flava TaxID=1285193 RepID=A0A931D8U2_9MICC|nr:PLDc N-terminal domain-containing protein [Zhihengliuella flava]MBG6084133.1 hypothetical protein [Zhihengliuella flava]